MFQISCRSCGMIKKRIIQITLACAVLFLAGFYSLESGLRIARAADDIDAVNKVIDDFQESYSAEKIEDFQTLFHHKAVIGIDFDSHADQTLMTLVEWTTGTKEMFSERNRVSDKLTEREINIYRGSLATVVCNYDYRDNVSHQTGMDVFTLMKIKGKWRIVSLIFSGDDVKKK